MMADSLFRRRADVLRQPAMARQAGTTHRRRFLGRLCTDCPLGVLCRALSFGFLASSEPANDGFWLYLCHFIFIVN